MSFPLPIDPAFRKEVIRFWIDDVYDRLELGKVEDAELSWKTANTLYLELPPGMGDLNLENLLVESRVKLNQHNLA